MYKSKAFTLLLTLQGLCGAQSTAQDLRPVAVVLGLSAHGSASQDPPVSGNSTGGIVIRRGHVGMEDKIHIDVD